MGYIEGQELGGPLKGRHGVMGGAEGGQRGRRPPGRVSVEAMTAG
jgi:hypothetical protein